ncbi:MAG TPA: hypothetical protein VD834_14145 [Blastococcus sp.]|jgi:hypothetical protein|nr:hypothetical protein [Blastococcus sp.]
MGEGNDMSGTQSTTVGAQLDEANLFDIDAPIAVHYSRSSIAGVPLLSYRDAEHDLSLSGEAIARLDTSIGELVTVTLDDVPDGFVRRFTLLVPVVRLRMGDEAEFAALGIETVDRSGAFVLPPGPAGVLQNHRTHQLTGVAQLVVF